MEHTSIDALVIKKMLSCEFVNGHKTLLDGNYAKIADAIEACQRDRRIRVAAFNAALDRIHDVDLREQIRRDVFAADGNQPLPEISFLQRHPFQPLEVSVILDCFAKGETGDADMLCRLFCGHIAYDHAEGQWYLCVGSYWQQDRTRVMYSLVATRVAPQYLYAAAHVATLDKSTENETLIRLLKERASALRSRRRTEAVLSLAGVEREAYSVHLTGDEWDKNPWVLACKNGVIDLKTGQLRQGRADEFIKAYAPTEWLGLDCPAPRWEQFIEEIFDGDKVMSDFMRRLFGYGITGKTESNEHCLPIFWGDQGRNGKGTMLEILGDVLGRDLAAPTNSEAIMETKYGNGSGPNPYLYNMRGKRLVWASETNEGKRLNVGEVKKLTGGDTMTPRTLHGKPVTFKPTHMLILLTNPKPHIPAGDDAMWDRLILVPFEVRFVSNPIEANERPRDKTLPNKLRAEASGILAWLVRGCIEWQQGGDDGLRVPDKCKAAKMEYKKEEDNVELFIEDICIVKATAKTKSSELYSAYVTWCKAGSMTPMNIHAFGKRMGKKFKREKSSSNWYHGIGLLSADHSDQDVYQEVNDD